MVNFKPHLLTLVGLCLYQASPSSATKGCGKDRTEAVKNARFRVAHSMGTMDTGMMSAWGGGGGPRGKIPDNSGTPFAGREFGGADRKTIYGTRLYGSGYAYGGSSELTASSVAGRPFPYGVWPISWGQNYLGGNEFTDWEMLRPGGELGIATVATTDTTKWPGIDTTKETYQMIGDRESLLFMMSDLVNWCHVTPQWPKSFDPSATNGTRPANVIQYYRASSFALAYSSFNNTAGLAWEPLPNPLGSSAFLQCINSTIGVALPIMDELPKKKGGLSGGAIAGIVIGSIVFCMIVVASWSSIEDMWDNYLLNRDLKKAKKAGKKLAKEMEKEEKERAKKERENNNQDELIKDDGKKGETKKDEENTVYQ